MQHGNYLDHVISLSVFSSVCSMSPPRLIRSAFGIFFEYDTPRIVHIRSKKVGSINRLLQLIIVGYIVGFVIIYKKGYQSFDNVESAVTTKLKGVVYTNFTNVTGLNGRIWDVADYVVPPQENGAFFVTTDVLVTPHQIQSVCEEDPGIPDANCTIHSCEANQPVVGGNGVKTGRCLNSTVKPGAQVCEIYAWCPVEHNDSTTRSPTAALAGSKNFTVFIKNNIEFPKFGVMRRNLPDSVDNDYLSNCHFNPNHPTDKYCPIFVLDTIVTQAGHLYDNMATEGGVIQIIISWNCDLDYHVNNCLPEYSFRRLDRGDYILSRGFNFRYANHFVENGTEMRDLYKVFGIRFIVVVQGTAGKFDVVPLFLNIGSGLALLSIATIICDVIVLYVLKAKNYYKDKKYLNVKGEDAYEAMEEASQSSHDESVRRRQTVPTSASFTENDGSRSV